MWGSTTNITPHRNVLHRTSYFLSVLRVRCSIRPLIISSCDVATWWWCLSRLRTHVLVLGKLLPNLGFPARVLWGCSARHSALGGRHCRSRGSCPCGRRRLRHGTCSEHYPSPFFSLITASRLMVTLRACVLSAPSEQAATCIGKANEFCLPTQVQSCNGTPLQHSNSVSCKQVCAGCHTPTTETQRQPKSRSCGDRRGQFSANRSGLV